MSRAATASGRHGAASPASPLPAGVRVPARGFTLTVQPGRGDTFGVTLLEDQGDGSDAATTVVGASAAQTGRVVDAVLAAVRASGYPTGRLAAHRGKPIGLESAAGVRLAVTLMAAQPITSNERIRRIVAGVNVMSVEETYYWYAKCMGDRQGPARKALRILLADPKVSE